MQQESFVLIDSTPFYGWIKNWENLMVFKSVWVEQTNERSYHDQLQPRKLFWAVKVIDQIAN